MNLILHKLCMMQEPKAWKWPCLRPPGSYIVNITNRRQVFISQRDVSEVVLNGLQNALDTL